MTKDHLEQNGLYPENFVQNYGTSILKYIAETNPFHQLSNICFFLLNYEILIFCIDFEYIQGNVACSLI